MNPSGSYDMTGGPEPSVLWVTDEVPDRDGPGGSIRQAHCLAGTAARAPVHLVLADDRPPPAAADLAGTTLVGSVDGHQLRGRLGLLLHTLTSRLPAGVRAAAPVRERLAGALPRVPAAPTVVVQQAWLAPLIRERRPGQRWVLDLHTVPSVRHEHARATAGTRRLRWYLRRERDRARRLEARVAAAYDRVVVPSAADARALPGSPVVVPNGVDTRRYRPSPLPVGPRVVFTGHLAYQPNIDGVRWFAAEVWPAVRRARPDASLALVGYQPGPEIRRLGERDGITVHADVPSVRPHLQAARAAVVPLRIGSGTRLKALQALAAGRPVVGTSIGLEGLGLRDGITAAIADAPGAMSRALLAVLEDDDTARTRATAGRVHVERHFSWSRLGARFAATVLGDDPPASPTLR